MRKRHKKQLNDSRIEHDPGTDYGETTNYNNLIKVITYDR
jgi:hypothetical protein